VWVVGNDQAVRREIVIDGYQADGVRVKSGLRAGERIVIDGYQKLYNGCRVIE
jgi:multidrug efflux pump subunit AcrA (membrane-fusion protein)